MITTYVLTFNSGSEFDEFISLVNEINSGQYVNRENSIQSIEALLYNRLKNNYICIFNSNGKILNTSILRKKFNLMAYIIHPDKKDIYLSLTPNVNKMTNSKNIISNEYFIFSNYSDMIYHYNFVHSSFVSNTQKLISL